MIGATVRLPYVIDNQDDSTRMSSILQELLSIHHGKAVDVATAFFSIRGFELLSDQLDELGSFRLLLGAEPGCAGDLGIHLDPGSSALRLQDLDCDPTMLEASVLKRELERAPLDEETQRLIEDLIRFLSNDWVQVRRYDRGFLHAKAWLFYADRTRSGQGIIFDRFQPLIGIVGSSNFTYPGLTGNKELNLSHRVILDDEEALDEQAAGMVEYLDEDAASKAIKPINRRLIKSEVGARAIADLVKWYEGVWEDASDYKDILIEVLLASKYGEQEYTPYEIYIKALWHQFRDDMSDEEPADRTTAVELTEFQEDAVRRARRVLARYHGVLIADAVGLGKTWIGKRLLEDYGYFQRQRVLVIAPASLRSMWISELTEANISHEFVSQESMGREDFNPFEYGDVDAILIDESHGFRNHLAQRYEALEQLLHCNGGMGRAGERKKTILLTATPINNDVFDLYNQLSIITHNNDSHFAPAGIGDLRKYFLAARRSENDGAGQRLFEVLEQVAVRRPRTDIRENYPDATINGKEISWPERELHTANYSIASIYGEDFYEGIVERIEGLHLASFDLESYLLDPTERDPMQVGRGKALTGIFRSLYLKRFESSVEAFRISIERARAFQRAYLEQLHKGRVLTGRDFRRLQVLKRDTSDSENSNQTEELLDGLEEVSKDDYDLELIEEHVQDDLQNLSEILGQVQGIVAERDAKYERLADLLRGELRGHKVIIFTYFKDTSRYLYRRLREDEELLKDLDHPNIRIADSDVTTGERDTILKHFAPRSNNAEHIAGTDKEIDILVSTDVLAEGRNLQDCQYLLNYDLPWAPTRLVQRAGRIDRIGTEFDTLHLWNFFPDAKLEELLQLVETLQGKLQVIDAQGLHDASVLGETPHPRAFNLIERVKDEDASVLDEEEKAAELATSEGLRMHLRKAMESGLGEQVEELPDGIHSSKQVHDEAGIFFCFEAHPDDSEHRQCFWIYWDNRTRQFEHNPYRIAQLIACERDEPRAKPLDTVYEVLPEAIQFVVDSTKDIAATREAQHKLPQEQIAVGVAIRDVGLRQGIGQDRVLELSKFLNQPLARFMQRQLRRLYLAYDADGDIHRLADEVEDLKRRFEGPSVETAPSETPPVLKPEDVHLVCFEYVR